MTPAQKRLVDEIRAQGGADEDGYGAEYWPVVNDWVKDAGSARALALRNINRTVSALIRDGYVTLNDDGCFHLIEPQACLLEIGHAGEHKWGPRSSRTLPFGARCHAWKVQS